MKYNLVEVHYFAKIGFPHHSLRNPFNQYLYTINKYFERVSETTILDSTNIEEYPTYVIMNTCYSRERKY